MPPAAVYKLPEELLLHIADQLPDSATPRHLKNLCLVSRKFRPAAQEALHTIAKLSVSCGCHPKVNAAVKLLRTLLDRPDLASKVKTLRFIAVRKNIAKLYEDKNFNLKTLRIRCLLKLEELGYKNTHPWWRSLENSIESAFAGLLLISLPNLVHLDFWVKDHNRGPPSGECISGLFGGMSAPDAIVRGWRSVRHLTTGDTHMLKSGIEFVNLTSLDLKTISIGTVLRLNGPGCLQGTENLRDLALTVSVQFADRPLVDKAEIQFGDLFDALGCNRLSSLKILFINDGYHIGDNLLTELDAGYFMDQLCSVQDALETLAITFENTDDDSELEWLLDMCSTPKGSLKQFAALKRLVMPQSFLFTTASPGGWEAGSCRPKNLPSQLESLELLYPHENIKVWAGGFLDKHCDEDFDLPNFKELTLTCRDEVGAPSMYFTTDVAKIWCTLSADLGIEAYALCQTEGFRKNLAELYHDEGSDRSGEGSTGEESTGTDEAADEDAWSDEEDDSDDDEMPDLIESTN